MTPRFLTSTVLTSLFCAAPTMANAQIWQDVPPGAKSFTAAQAKTAAPQDSRPWARKVDTDMDSLEFLLAKAPQEQSGRSDVTIDLPLPDGGVATFSVLNSPIIAPGLAQKYPNIQTFRVIGTQNSSQTGRLSLTANGFHGMFKYNGDIVYIDPINGHSGFNAYFDGDSQALSKSGHNETFSCGFDAHESQKSFTPLLRKDNGTQISSAIAQTNDVRVYRTAIATTAEFTQDFGGTTASGLAKVVDTINRLNVFYEDDIAVRFELIANNDQLIFTDPDTDPYEEPLRSGAVLSVANASIADIVGEESYDIGHVFGTFGGGVAGFQSLCAPGRKGGAVSGTVNTSVDSFVAILAHEMGHQFGAPHSFNGSLGSCASQRSERAAAEPHSGTTFMSYAGLCLEENLTGRRGRFFHNSSQVFMTDYVADPAGGGRCGTDLATNNTGPTVNAGADNTIPMSTPFTLTGTASDADGDSLLNIWEQVDVGARNMGPDDVDQGSGPLFRSFTPEASVSRTFPQLARVLAGDNVIGEILPSTDRTLTFRMTARDNKGGVTDDERLVTVTTTAGPFTIASPASPSLEAGVAHNVTWDVANTAAAPVSCDMVKLELSTDGGNTFPHLLSAATANDGAASVTFPNVTTTTGRLKASCNTQPFFAINDANFTMTPMVIVNMAPSAANDTLTTQNNFRRVEVNVLANDSDPEGDSLTVSSVTQPNQGGATELSGNSIFYTPLTSFTGTETFSYTVNDGNNNTSSATVTVTVNPPPNSAPAVQNTSAQVFQDSEATLIDVLAGASDPEGDTITLQSVSAPSAGGSAVIQGSQVSYMPATGYLGAETFTYTVNDGNNNTSSATVSISVLEPPNSAPVLQDASAEVIQDSEATLINVLAGAVDAEGDTITLQSVSAPSAGGTAVIQDGQVSYVPAAGYLGTETFTYTVNDGKNNTSTANVSINVLVPPNAPPVLQEPSVSVVQNSAASLIDVLAGATDADGDTITLLSIGTPSAGGTASIQNGQVSYTPARGFSGTETFVYTVSDGEGAEVTGTVTVSVLPVQVSNDFTTPSSSGGGGPFGPLLLLLLWIRARTEKRRARRGAQTS